MNVSGHDADLALAGRDDARTVWSNQTGQLIAEVLFHLHHIERWNAFSNTNHHGNSRISGFHYGVGSERRRNVDHGSIGAHFFDGIGDSVEDGNSLVRCSTLSRRPPTHNA